MLVENGFVVKLSLVRDKHLSARVPAEVRRDLGAFARSQHWSLADAVIYLLCVGLAVMSEKTKG